MTKSKKQKQIPNQQQPKPRRALWLTLAALVLLAAAWFFYKNKAAAPTPFDKAPYEEESTLRAKNPRMRLVPAAESGIDFVNTITETPENNILNNTNFYNGGGVAVADINNDGLPDLFFINCNGKNALYLNQGKLKFKNITKGSGLDSGDGFETAVTAADVNADGYLDFYVCRAGPFSPDKRRNKLYINNKNLTFTESAAAYGLDAGSMSTGANFFDYDLDGDLDLYLLNYPTNFEYASKIEADIDPATNNFKPRLKPKSEFDSDRLYRNDSPQGPPLPPLEGGSAAVGINGGESAKNSEKNSTPNPTTTPKATRNSPPQGGAGGGLGGGGGLFTDVSKEAGIQNFAYGLSVSVSDFNADGWPDIYVGNDFIQPDILYINNKNGTFSNQLSRYFQHTAQHTMGTDLSDFDNDGRIDLFAVDMLPVSHYRQKTTASTNAQSRYNTLVQYGYFEPVVRNVLQRNNGNGTFSDIACLAGVYKTDWSWSGLLFDIDNDGLKDMAVTNGYRREIADLDYMNFTVPELQGATIKNFQEVFQYIPTYKIRNFVYQNRGNWTFEDQSGQWLDVPPSWSNGAAWADLDADGDLDWVVNNLEDKAFVYENLSSGQPDANYLQLKLSGGPQNPFAVGAAVLIKTNDTHQYQELNPTRGIFSSVEHLIHFGLENAAQVDEIQVLWPNGQKTTLQNIPANQRLQLRQDEANGSGPLNLPQQTALTLFEENTVATGLRFQHTENTYNDFDDAFLLPWKHSELGPTLTCADVNADGLDDVFIGNAFNSPAALYLQTPAGSFRLSSAAVWEADKAYEDAGALFFDADGDSDPDLFVLNGGPEADAQGAGIAWQCRLYLNDGKGNFQKAPEAPPALPNVCSTTAAHDYDGDGDLDLFIGGRMVAGKYPMLPNSFVLQNNGGKFTDVSAQVAGDFANCGMVTALTWANVDADPQPELIAVGEWMHVSVFKLQNGKLKNVSAKFGLEKSNGLWNCLTAADLDNDGDTDLLTGNFGLNSRLTAAPDAPLRCYGHDFDGNGRIEPVLSHVEAGKEYPLMRQDAMTKQMPALKKDFLYAKSYGRATIADLFSKDARKAALVLQAYTLASGWWENQGGRFVFHALPPQAQAAPVFGMLAADFNGDSKTDILLAGNKYGIEVETGRCDAGVGALFLGDGRGGFKWLPNVQSGFYAPGEVRDLLALRGAGGKLQVVVSNNNAAAQVFRVR